MRRNIVSALLFGFLILGFSSRAQAQANFNATLAEAGVGTYNVSWTAAVDPASTTAKALYFVISTFGFVNPGIVPNVPYAITSSVFDATSLTVSHGEGTRCFVVVA